MRTRLHRWDLEALGWADASSFEVVGREIRAGVIWRVVSECGHRVLVRLSTIRFRWRRERKRFGDIVRVNERARG